MTSRGYDVFFDYNSIKAGDFEQIILSEIEARGHFLIVLTPSALERCKEPGDWVRREIEHALQHQRNIIPLTFEGFDFKDMDKYLDGELQRLKNYNALRVPIDYFDAAMDRLSNDYLNIPIDAVLHPAPTQNQPAVQQAIQHAKSEPQPTHNQMTAEEYYERGNRRADDDYDGKISDYSEAIRLKPDYAEAYNNRGVAFDNKRDYSQAIANYNEAIRLEPDDAIAYNDRGKAYIDIGDYNRAVVDFNEAIRLKSDFPEAYNNRGIADRKTGKTDQAITDYNEAIRLKSDYANAYLNRGIVYEEDKKDYQQANRDYQQYLDLGGSRRDEVRGWIEDNKRRMQ